MAATVDEVVSAAWVIQVEPEEVLKDHSVVIHEGKILDVCPTAEVASKYAAKVQTSLPAQALMPGFVNTHTHTPMVYLRGVSDDIPLRQWLETCIWPLEFKFCDAEFVREGTELAVLEMIRGGVTTFNDMYWFPESICEVVARTGVRAAIGIIAIEFPFGSYGTGPEDYLEKGLKARERFKDEPLISWTVALHAPYTCSDKTLQMGNELSEKLGVPLHIHLHETEEEVVDSASGEQTTSKHLSDQKTTPIANFKRLGLMTERLLAVHMNWLTPDEITMCGECSASVVHCPCSGLKLASGFCPVAKLQDAGVNVALGTDGASSNNTLDMMAEMKTAAIMAKAVAKDARAVPAARALRMATLNGAKALGLGAVTGSLSVGKDADMIAVDFSGPATWPVPTSASAAHGFDPVTHIVYSSNRDQVTDVWVRGARLMKSREVLTIEVNAVRAKAEKWGQKISEEVGRMADEAAAKAAEAKAEDVEMKG